MYDYTGMAEIGYPIFQWELCYVLIKMGYFLSVSSTFRQSVICSDNPWLKLHSIGGKATIQLWLVGQGHPSEK